MKAETWLPILTLALGWAGAQVTEIFRDRRASNRERQARQAELQRTTLLALQDALLETSNLASEAQLEAFVATLDHRDESRKREADERAREARDRLQRARDKARLLTSRVQDEPARRAATLFRHATSMVTPFNPETEEQDMKRVTEAYGKAIDLLGKLIRERY